MEPTPFLPLPRREDVIDQSAGRSKELAGKGDSGEGDLVLTQTSVTFETFRGRSWTLSYREVDCFRIRRGLLGYLFLGQLRTITFNSKGRRHRATIGFAAAANAAHILQAHGVAGGWAWGAKPRRSAVRTTRHMVRLLLNELDGTRARLEVIAVLDNAELVAAEAKCFYNDIRSVIPVILLVTNRRILMAPLAAVEPGQEVQQVASIDFAGIVEVDEVADTGLVLRSQMGESDALLVFAGGDDRSLIAGTIRSRLTGG